MMVDLQIACDDKNLPSLAQLEQWTTLALQTPNTAAEITIRMVDNEESHALNLQYRGQDKATNVLSFPFETPEFEDPTLAAEIAHELGPVSYLGDLVGQIFTMFVLTVAAAEAAIGLAILVSFFRTRGTIDVEDANVMKG